MSPMVNIHLLYLFYVSVDSCIIDIVTYVAATVNIELTVTLQGKTVPNSISSGAFTFSEIHV